MPRFCPEDQGVRDLEAAIPTPVPTGSPNPGSSRLGCRYPAAGWRQELGAQC